MTELYDLSRPVSITSFLILLVLAGVMGALIVRFTLYRRIHSLNAIIADKNTMYQYFRRASRGETTPLFEPESFPVTSDNTPDIQQGQSSVTTEEVAVTEKLAAKLVKPAPVKASLAKEPRKVFHYPPVSELNFDRIGRDKPEQADDLTKIAGVGPLLRDRLNAIGIYTYRQIANFTPEDSRQVTKLTEFIPGRIERDNWVGQARKLYERKYTSLN